MTEALTQLSDASLGTLAASLRDGALSMGVARHAVEQIAGPHAASVHSCLEGLLNQGMTPRQVALLVQAIVDTRARVGDPSLLFDLVLSGPDVPGVPTTDTASVMHTLIQEARSEVLLIGYAVHNGQRLFEPLAAKMRSAPEIAVRFCLDIRRKPNDTSLSGEIVHRFVHEFRTKHWPWPQLPELFYDPRSLNAGDDKRSSLHAKCIVVDRRAALVTSANFTEAAQKRNIEVGVLVRYQPLVGRLAGYFDGLLTSGDLVRCPLEDS